MARPKAKVDGEQVLSLALMHCTNKEIAGFFGVSQDTIERRFAVELAKGRQSGKIRLRKWQMQAAEKGNVAMLIWLGKNMLGQSDKIIIDEQDLKHNDSEHFSDDDKTS
jgi:hypothetical protein